MRVFLLSLLSLFISTSVLANTIITSPPPFPSAASIEPPRGYASCDMIPAAWEGHIWVSLHQVCHYPSANKVAVWVSGYWACSQPKANGKCMHWVWNKSHWNKTQLRREAYYNHHEHALNMS